MPDTIAAVPDAGGYFSLAKIIFMLVLIVPWLLALPWVNKDAYRHHLSQTTWSGTTLGLGALGVLLWLVVGHYLVGLLLFLALAGGSLLAYVLTRDKRVPDERKVLTFEHLANVFTRRRPPPVEVLSEVKIYASNSRIVLPPNPAAASAEQCHAYNLAQEMLHEIVWRRASEADLSPKGGGMRLLLVIDGMPVERPGPAAADGETVIQFLKEHGGMNVEDRRRPQQGRIEVGLGEKIVDLELTTAGSTTGQRMQFRVAQEAVRTKLDELGMADDALARVRELLHQPSGLIIASGMPRNGVTSTLYSLLREYDAFTQLLVAIERRPEVDLENVTQKTYADAAEIPEVLASVVRRDPDVILLDACPDARTAAAVCEASDRKNLLLGMHAPDSFVALAKWVKVSGHPEDAMRNLRAVLCQVLLRKLCTACREAYRPDPQFLAKANLQSQHIDRFYRPPSEPLTDEKGRPVVCPSCQGSGYVGRTGAFELLELTDRLRELVLSGATVSQIKAEARKNKMLYLQERALQKVIRGETSVQEVIRVSQAAQKK
jgi:type II secretory ATPase GspE/PulE/Tfp pilus assembly ATPase PilB-like protein